MSPKQQIAAILDQILHESKYYLVNLEVSNSKVRAKVVVLIDSDEGILIDECAEISRQLDQQLEETGVLPYAYTLEVSSPGIDFPLAFPRQYTKNIGRSLKVVRTDGVEKRGKLTTVTDTHIVLEQEGKRKKSETETNEFVIAFAEIAKAQVQITFK
jgi:ribosome maturation factor RimP